VPVGDYAVRRVGNSEYPSSAGVDVPGVAFLLPDSFHTDGVVFAFAAYYRNSNPVRYQLWRPVESTEPGNVSTAAPESSSETTVRLLSQITITPSVRDSSETVSTTIVEPDTSDLVLVSINFLIVNFLKIND